MFSLLSFRNSLLIACFQEVANLDGAIDRETNGIRSFQEEVRSELKNAEVAARNLARLTSGGPALRQENVYLPSSCAQIDCRCMLT